MVTKRVTETPCCRGCDWLLLRHRWRLSLKLTGSTVGGDEGVRHHVKVTVLDKKCFCDLQEAYLADPRSGPCGVFEVGDTFEFWHDGGRDAYTGSDA